MDEERLELRYVPLATAHLWDENPKLHDVGGIAESIKRHGFVDPPKFDPALNGGRGGIVYGNGRLKTLLMMKRQGDPPPRGVAVTEDGDWAVPVVFGVDAASEAVAKALALDHNNLTMLGGDFTVWDVARMWEQGGYHAVLEELAAAEVLPVSVDGDDLDGLKQIYTGPPSLDELAAEYGEPGERDFWPVIKVQVSPETEELYKSLMAQVPSDDEAAKFKRLMSAVDATVLGVELP